MSFFAGKPLQGLSLKSIIYFWFEVPCYTYITIINFMSFSTSVHVCSIFCHTSVFHYDNSSSYLGNTMPQPGCPYEEGYLHLKFNP